VAHWRKRDSSLAAEELAHVIARQCKSHYGGGGPHVVLLATASDCGGGGGPLLRLKRLIREATKIG
jgi:hypothetical protein